MDQAVANLQQFTGASLETAVRLASTNPAAMLGTENTIAPGQPANFNRFDANGGLQATILDGVPVGFPFRHRLRCARRPSLTIMRRPLSTLHLAVFEKKVSEPCRFGRFSFDV